MRSATNDCRLPRTTRSTSLQAVNFKDGMIITAGDLQTAVAYPLAVFQTLVRSFFGCGIVCGLQTEARTLVKIPDDKNAPAPEKPDYVISIKPGTAIDCHGFPLELCEAVRLNLAPGQCCPIPPKVCIAIRHITSDGAPRQDCGCSDDCGCKGGDQHGDCGCNGKHSRPGSVDSYHCTRTKHHVLIEAFPAEKLEQMNICGSDAVTLHDKKSKDRDKKPSTYIECMTSCPDCDCCGDAWVLLGCFELSKYGVSEFTVKGHKEDGRKYVKPIACTDQFLAPRSTHAPSQDASTGTAADTDTTGLALPSGSGTGAQGAMPAVRKQARRVSKPLKR